MWSLSLLLSEPHNAAYRSIICSKFLAVTATGYVMWGCVTLGDFAAPVSLSVDGTSKEFLGGLIKRRIY